MTTGLWPEDVTVFVARTGIGKTMALVVCAADAFRQGKKVLFVSTEMAGSRIAARYFAFDCKVPYQDLRSGALSAFVEPIFMGEIQKRATSTGFWLVGGGFDIDMRSIEAAVGECKPDIVFVDGMYLVKGRGEDRYEEASNAIHDIKRLAKRLQLPFVLSTQFNRSVKQNATKGSLESISLSDVIGWDSDWVFGLFQDDDMRANRRMKIDTLKAREGDPVGVEANWNWDAQDFSEVLGTSGSTPHDPDFDNVPV
jgi:replicative DNA helicase